MACENEIEQVGSNRYTISASVNKYTLTAYNGAYARLSQVWQKNLEPIEVPVAVSVVTNDLFKKTIGPIIFLDQTPCSWYKTGIRQDKEAGTLDFTNWVYGPEYQGDIFLEYLP